MKRDHILLLLFMLAGIMFSSFSYPTTRRTSPTEVPYPEDYREWTHVKSTVVRPKHQFFKLNGGFNHVYANKEAMQGYKTGPFPNKSMIVFDVVEGKEDTTDIREGKHRRIDVMLKDTVVFASTNGWGFESFSGDTPAQRLLTLEMKNNCASCHSKQADLVFSEFRK